MALHKLCGGRFQFDRLHHNFDATMFILPQFSDGILSTWTFLVKFRWTNQMRCWILGVKKTRRLPIAPQKITLTLNRNSSGSRKNAFFFAQEKFLLTGPLNSQDLRKKKICNENWRPSPNSRRKCCKNRQQKMKETINCKAEMILYRNELSHYFWSSALASLRNDIGEKC